MCICMLGRILITDIALRIQCSHLQSWFLTFRVTWLLDNYLPHGLIQKCSRKVSGWVNSIQFLKKEANPRLIPLFIFYHKSKIFYDTEPLKNIWYSLGPSCESCPNFCFPKFPMVVQKKKPSFLGWRIFSAVTDPRRVSFTAPYLEWLWIHGGWDDLSVLWKHALPHSSSALPQECVSPQNFHLPKCFSSWDAKSHSETNVCSTFTVWKAISRHPLIRMNIMVHCNSFI